ncbi:hypothetical protein RhiJN_13486 [Ceratobasidium sp. AG-Ba]|nr:hypothetical protein RhiJN_13486 [Ceratobasidium sp. AG-Ba]
MHCAGLLLAALTLFVPVQAILTRVDSDSGQGQPISVGLAANRSQPAEAIFGTTTAAPNFLTLPTTLCIVPMYADEAGLGKVHKPVTVQQALEICPRAQRIVVCQN